LQVVQPEKQEIFGQFKKDHPFPFHLGERDDYFPYWAKLWHSAIALGEFLKRNIHFIKDKQVLELGAGLGLPGLVASGYAKTVLITDREINALDCVNASIKINNITNCITRQLNWEDLLPETSCDVLLLSDINYDQSQFGILEKLIQQFLNKRVTILLATPQRLVSKPFLQNLMPYFILNEEQEIVYDGEKAMINIMVMQAP
jgi:predicted nicotinamide N-methyase